MSFAYYNANYNQEKEIAEALIKSSPKRLESTDISNTLIGHINAQFAANNINRQLIAAIRLTIKLNPYAGDVTGLYTLFCKAKRAHAEARFPGIFASINACKEKGVPLPLIISCAKYMDGALKLQRDLTPHYFGIQPIVVRGDTSIEEEKFENGVLSLPVDDTYEGVPLKMLELFTLISAIDDKISVFKCDDDIEVKPEQSVDLGKLQAVCGAGDYVGISVASALHGRMWHYGKCVKPVPFSYGKPMKGPWARGALYYLSSNALQTLVKYYLRFPGLLEGEMYEDKAIGDIMFDNNIRLLPYPLEGPLSLDSTSPER